MCLSTTQSFLYSRRLLTAGFPVFMTFIDSSPSRLRDVYWQQFFQYSWRLLTAVFPVFVTFITNSLSRIRDAYSAVFFVFVTFINSSLSCPCGVYWQQFCPYSWRVYGHLQQKLSSLWCSLTVQSSLYLLNYCQYSLFCIHDVLIYNTRLPVLVTFIDQEIAFFNTAQQIRRSTLFFFFFFGTSLSIFTFLVPGFRWSFK